MTDRYRVRVIAPKGKFATDGDVAKVQAPEDIVPPSIARARACWHLAMISIRRATLGDQKRYLAWVLADIATKADAMEQKP